MTPYRVTSYDPTPFGKSLIFERLLERSSRSLPNACALGILRLLGAGI